MVGLYSMCLMLVKEPKSLSLCTVMRCAAKHIPTSVWMMPYTTCDEMDLDNENRLQSRSSIWERENDAGMLAQGVPETAERRERRLKDEGRFDS